ncbi:hypothetical protein BC941DRAFT_437817 [Chlamydoabsidia padenii]|nr:hypothetical protein BC941DRAFT_437817 [Chlamydoabsidia padenii]
MWGKLIHWTADAILITTLLAGIKRNTGLQPKISLIGNDQLVSYMQQYLALGEWVLDTSIVYMNDSIYFERSKR